MSLNDLVLGLLHGSHGHVGGGEVSLVLEKKELRPNFFTILILVARRERW